MVMLQLSIYINLRNTKTKLKVISVISLKFIDFEEISTDKGIELHITISSEAFAELKQRRRNLVGRTGCGLCGAESLEQAIPQPKSISNSLQLSHADLQKAIIGLANWQQQMRLCIVLLSLFF